MKSYLTLLAIMLLSLAGCHESELTFMVGTLERDRVEVSVESNEPIIAIPVQDGQMLQSGDLILQQDPARLQSQLAQQMALREQAAARLEELQQGARQEDISAARAQLASAQATASNANDTLKRAKTIYERKLSDQATLDRAVTNQKTAAAAEQAARQALERLLNGTRVEELHQAIAAVDAQDAQIRQTELSISRLDIHAPVSGMLDKRLYQVGERPPAGATIAVILDDSRTYARIYVPEPQRSLIQPGRQLNVRIDGINQAFKGTVRWVSADATFTPYFALTEHDRARLSYLAEVDVPGAADLPSGVPLEVDLPLSAGDKQ